MWWNAAENVFETVDRAPTFIHEIMRSSFGSANKRIASSNALSHGFGGFDGASTGIGRRKMFPATPVVKVNTLRKLEAPKNCIQSILKCTMSGK